ncbi:MAG: glycosyl hydrolase-related protein [Candidatus Eisenbacteria bacterium]
MPDAKGKRSGATPGNAHVVSHTHWDREWYLTFHQFRVHLVSTIRLVLDELEREGEFRHFLLDGQTAAIEDFLEVAPEERGRLAGHVRSGALSIGPWYVLPDEFLVSAEATVRNLLVGNEVGRDLGPVQKVGYMPDSFGHVAQMPQILRGAGIDSFVYTRGNGDEIDELGSEYLWRAPDGTEVLAVNQCGGYGNAAALGHAELWHAHTKRSIDPALAVGKVRELFRRAAAASNADVRLLMNGSDHLPPQREFDAVIAALREAFPETAFHHGSLADYVSALRGESPSLPAFEGELLGGKHYHILSGVWSARMPLKQANDRAQSVLADELEPLAAYAHFALGDDYPRGLIDYAWRLLLKNHPHDSICGCSIDEVHHEMEPRFAGVTETAERLIRNTLEAQTPMFAADEADDRDTAICVANALPFERDAVVDRLVVFVPPAPDLERLVLEDESGRAVPFEIVEETYVERFWGVDYRTEIRTDAQRELFRSYLATFGDRMLRRKGDPGLTDCFLRVRFLAEDLPPVGHAVYRLVERDGGAAGRRTPSSSGAPGRALPEGLEPARACGSALTNGLVTVTLHGDGTFDLVDERTGETYPGLNELSDREDVGDEYDYSPCETPLEVTSEGACGDVRVADAGDVVARLEVDLALRVPSSIAPDRRRRGDALVDCPVSVRVALEAGSPVVDVELVFENRALDHRVRAIFPTSIAAERVVSDGHFYLNERPVATDEHPDWVQPPPGTYPQQEYSLLEDGDRGLAVLARGLPEIEASRTKDGGTALALTLLRSVGWLSRDDFPARRCQNAGPTLQTPDAQCLGRHVFRYAVLAYSGGHLRAGVKRRSRAWRSPVPSVQGVWKGHTPGARGLVATTSDLTCVSAVKSHQQRDTLVVRLYNLAAEPVSETLTFGRRVRGAWRVDLLEERVGDMSANGDALAFELRPHEIVTVEVEF